MRNIRHRRGNTVIEFALACSVLVPTMLGAFQFAYAYYQYATLEAAVRHAARYASVLTYDSATSTPTTSYASAVSNMLLTGNPNPPVPGIDAEPRMGSLDSSNVDVKMDFANGIPSQVTVSLKGYSIDAFVARLAMDGRPKATLPYVGRWSAGN